jgi:hypothetical protein
MIECFLIEKLAPPIQRDASAATAQALAELDVKTSQEPGRAQQEALLSGLEPHFRVLFSAIFQLFPWRISSG